MENEKDMQKMFSDNIENAISEFCSEQNDDTNLKVLNAIVAGMMNGVEITAAAGFDNMPDLDALKEGAELSGLHFIKFNYDDKSFFVMYTSDAKIAEFQCPSMLRCGLYNFLVNAKHEEELAGIIINPGKENYVMNKETVIALLDYVYDINKPYQEIEMGDNMVINIPKVLQEVNAMPDDPEGTRPFVLVEENCNSLVIMYPMDIERAMPLEYPQLVIDGIHQCLGENQGLIEVKNGETKSGRKFLYSIVKNVNGGEGVQYCLTFEVEFDENVVHLQCFFDEKGMTGSRDAYVFELARRENKIDIDNNMAGWAEDPYDKEYSNGILRNLSEDEVYDEMFQQHPLSKARSFVRFVLENN